MNSPSQQSVGRFFDSLSDDYTATIERCFPRYREMLWATLDYLPAGFEPETVLELGPGTGNLSVLLAEKYPDALTTLVDVAPDSLAVCQQRLGDSDRFTFQQEDFRKLDYADESFDLIASSIAIHHLKSNEKRALFSQIQRWLKPNGIFAYVDQHAGVTQDLYERHIENWRQLSLSAGSTSEEWDMWMQHQHEHDHHDTLGDQMSWLSQAGFRVVDCPWRYLLWTVLQARK